MGKILTVVAITLLVAVAWSHADAQTPPGDHKKDPAGAQTTSPPVPPPADAGKVKDAEAKDPKALQSKTKDTVKVELGEPKRRVHKAKPRRHARARHRVARHRGWRPVWVYRAHDRHGHRHYHLVWRKFGGYFARSRDCSCWYRGRRWHM